MLTFAPVGQEAARPQLVVEEMLETVNVPAACVARNMAGAVAPQTTAPMDKSVPADCVAAMSTRSQLLDPTAVKSTLLLKHTAVGGYADPSDGMIGALKK